MAVLDVCGQRNLIDPALLRKGHPAITIHLIGDRFNQCLLSIHDGKRSIHLFPGVALSQQSGLQSLSAAILPGHQVEDLLRTVCTLCRCKLALIIGFHNGTLSKCGLDRRQMLTGIDGHVHIHIRQNLLHALIELGKLLRRQGIRLHAFENLPELLHELLDPPLDILQDTLVLSALRPELSQPLSGIGIQQHSLAGITDHLFECFIPAHFNAVLLRRIKLLRDHGLQICAPLPIILNQEIRERLILFRRSFLRPVNQLMPQGKGHHGLPALIHTIQVQMDGIGIGIIKPKLSGFPCIHKDIHIGSLGDAVRQPVGGFLGLVERILRDTILKHGMVLTGFLFPVLLQALLCVPVVFIRLRLSCFGIHDSSLPAFIPRQFHGIGIRIVFRTLERIVVLSVSVRLLKPKGIHLRGNTLPGVERSDDRVRGVHGQSKPCHRGVDQRIAGVSEAHILRINRASILQLQHDLPIFHGCDSIH